jgi:hypothetical protein
MMEKYNEELHNLNSSYVQLIKLGRKRWVGHVVRMGEMWIPYEVLFRKLEGREVGIDQCYSTRLQGG